jgi:beta-glucanase (GH16 family)
MKILRMIHEPGFPSRQLIGVRFTRAPCPDIIHSRPPIRKTALPFSGKLRSCAVAALLACVTGAARAEWQLAWSDEFEGDSVNANHWTFDIGNGSGGWGNHELQYYTSRPENAYASNGVLHIVARRESYSGFHYTSAKLKTAGSFSRKYGRFEFRIRLPQGQGYWPAAWMMPEHAVYGGWAASGEIDVMENRGNDPTTVLGTIHFGATHPHNTQSFGPPFTFSNGDSVTNFHVYALEWTTNAMRWYVDNQLFETQTEWWSSSNGTNSGIRNPSPAPFNQPFYLILNLAVGGKFGGNPDATTIFPGEMQVDYVRVYDWTGAPSPVLESRPTDKDSPGSTATPAGTAGDGVSASVPAVQER